MENRQQKAFKIIKIWLQKPPVLYIPDNKKRFYPYSDTNTFDTDSTPYQNYSITKLEIWDVATNIASFFFHLLKEIVFCAVLDHLNLKYFE